MTRSRLFAAAAAAVPLLVAGAAFLALDGLGAAEAANEPSPTGKAPRLVASVDCSAHVWPHIPASCLDGASEPTRTVTVLDRPVARP